MLSRQPIAAAAGETLRRWLIRETRSWRAIVEAFSAAGRGLAAAHAADVIHRDFKPDNVLIGKDGRIRVGDFGVASAAARPIETVGPELAAQIDAADLRHGLTRQGTAIGTPAYMAPEQQDAAVIDARADQYAFCVALYEALYGTRPFQGDNYPALREAKRLPVPDAPAGSKVPSWLRAIVLRGLSEAPGDRFPSMEALLRALGRDPAQARRRLAAVATAAIVCVVAAWGLLRPPAAVAEPCTGAHLQLDGVWDADARGRIERAFAAVGAQGAGYAPDSARRVVAGLDAYADGWAAMRTEACRATRVSGEQSEQLLDLRMACLERRRDGLQELVGVLADADATVVERGIQAIVDLPPLSGCADAAALTARVPPPRGALMAARVAALDAHLARAEALQSAGKYAAGIAVAEPLVREADATGHAPLQARAHFALGLLETYLAQPEPAERELLAAVDFASQAHDDELLPKVLGILLHLYVEVKAAPRWRSRRRRSDRTTRTSRSR